MCKIAICDDDKEYREKIKTVIETEGILSSNEIRFYEYESGKELLEDADILHDLIFMDMRMPGCPSTPMHITPLILSRNEYLPTSIGNREILSLTSLCSINLAIKAR